MRSLLLEEPVVYRGDLTDGEWAELRRRQGEEARILNEMFGLGIEARAEGLAAIDPEGGLTDSRFPAGGTVGQAALLLIDRLVAADRNPVERRAVVAAVAELAEVHRVQSRHWAQIADDPESLTHDILELLQDHRLVQVSGESVKLRPAAWRYAVEVRIEQGSLL